MENTCKADVENMFNAFDNMLEGIAVYKLIFNDKGRVIDGLLKYVNQAAVKTMNLNPEEDIGKTVTELFDLDYVKSYKELINEYRATGKYKRLEIYYSPLDKYFLISGFDMSDNLFAILRIDITEQKKAEEELRQARNNLEEQVEERTAELKESEEKFRELFNNANDMISLNEMKENGLPGRFIEVNDMGTRRLGYSKDELLNMSPVDIVASDKKIEMSNNAMELWTKGQAKFEIVHLTKDGRRISVEVNNYLFKFKGRIIALAISRDITKRKKTEEEMKKLIDDLKRSNDELNQFAYVSSHDLQEPLRTIASFTQLLERRYKGKLDSDADEFMDYIVDAAVRMKQQIDDLLEYSRVTTDGRTYKRVNTNSILNQVINNLKSSIEENNAEITHEPLPNVIGDSDQLMRVFQNLIGNALKYRELDEPPKIHISAHENKEKNEYIFSVSDNGIGIEKQYLDRIFGVFQRLHTIDQYKGTGIGLSVVKKVVERHGGHIWVESEVGKGSTFYFTLSKL